MQWGATGVPQGRNGLGETPQPASLASHQTGRQDSRQHHLSLIHVCAKPRPPALQMADQRVNSPSGGLWSSFHSSLAQSVRGPGTPQRQQETAARAESSAAAKNLLEEFKTKFTELDLLME